MSSETPVVRWAALYNHGVTVAIAPDTEIGTLDASLARVGGHEPVFEATRVAVVKQPGASVVYYKIPSRVFDDHGTYEFVLKQNADAIFSQKSEIGSEIFAGNIDYVEDYCVVGWASPLSNDEDFQVELLVDGRPVARAGATHFRADLIYASALGGWNGFSLPIPEDLLDGSPHELAVRAGRTILNYGPWQAKPRLRLDIVDPHRIAGWFYDEGASDKALPVRLIRDGRVLESARSIYRPDVGERHGHFHVGFDFVETRIEPGTEVFFGRRRVAVVEAGGLLPVFDRLRARARALLLASPRAQDTLPERRHVAGAEIDFERGRSGRPLLDARPTGVPSPAAADGREPPAGAAAPEPAEPPRVCAIVPVYKGLADLVACIDSLLPQVSAGRTRLIVIDDASPDDGIVAYLNSLAERNLDGVRVLHNPTNLGFIETVNRGFSQLEPGEDAVLVNADTVLPRDGIAKLARRCHERPGIASVTPLSNNATILSFPLPAAPSPPLFGLSADELDATFQSIGSPPTEIPTAIGFCMYVNRLALDEVGTFSLKWGRGYCEEVEWSLLARDLGWIHLAALDTFVIHEGSVSFGVSEREKILETNHARLEALFPEYLDDVQRICRTDPIEPTRLRVFAALVAQRLRRLSLHLTHDLGGGTQRYIDDLSALPRADDHELGQLKMVAGPFGKRMFGVTFASSSCAIEFSETCLVAFAESLAAAGIDVHLYIDSRLKFPSHVLSDLSTGSVPYSVVLHDYQWYCPKVTLLNETQFYCGEPEPAVCQMCVRHGGNYDFSDQNILLNQNFEEWLAFNRAFLARAAVLIAPSNDTAKRYAARFGLGNIVARPHPERIEAALAARGEHHSGEGALRIAVVGAIGDHKGYELIEGMAEIAARRRLPIAFRIIGYTRDDMRLSAMPNIGITGRYGLDELQQLLEVFQPSFVLLPSPWPETYSYVLSEVWNAGYPAVAFDLGAMAERIRETGLGAVVPVTRDPATLLSSLQAVVPDIDRLGALHWRRSPPASLETYLGSGSEPSGSEPKAEPPPPPPPPPPPIIVSRLRWMRKRER